MIKDEITTQDQVTIYNPEDIAYLESIVRPLLEYPQVMRVERKTDEKGVLITMSFKKEDMGRVIGKNGETARSIRRLIKQFGMSHGSRIAMKINEPI